MQYSKTSNFIWYEKYRPSTINTLALNPNYKKAFQSYIEQSNIPHLLLGGPQGSGKTTIGHILMQTIPCIKLELNASSKERGVGTVKGLIKDFAASKTPNNQLKILLLDEADGLTPDALNALKGTMETYSANCRFILTCNNLNKIIPPIQSRCTIFTFERFPQNKVEILCKRILKKENITISSTNDISAIVSKYYPDIRSIINNMQLASISGALNLSSLVELQVDPAEIGNYILKGELFSIRKYLANTVDFIQIYRWLYDAFIPNNGTQSQKSEMVLCISEALALDLQVPDREINFIACCINIMDCLDIKANF